MSHLSLKKKSKCGHAAVCCSSARTRTSSKRILFDEASPTRAWLVLNFRKFISQSRRSKGAAPQMYGKNLCPRMLASDRLARGTWRRDWPRAFTGGSPHQHEPMALKSRVDFAFGRCAVTCSPTSPICHAPHGVLLILGACPRRRIGETRHRLHGHWWAQRVGDHLVAEPDVWLQHRPQHTTRRTAQMAPGQRR